MRTCDRCEAEIAKGGATVDMRNGESGATLPADLCSGCFQALGQWIAAGGDSLPVSSKSLEPDLHRDYLKIVEGVAS